MEEGLHLRKGARRETTQPQGEVERASIKLWCAAALEFLGHPGNKSPFLLQLVSLLATNWI